MKGSESNVLMPLKITQGSLSSEAKCSSKSKSLLKSERIQKSEHLDPHAAFQRIDTHEPRQMQTPHTSIYKKVNEHKTPVRRHTDRILKVQPREKTYPDKIMQIVPSSAKPPMKISQSSLGNKYVGERSRTLPIVSMKTSETQAQCLSPHLAASCGEQHDIARKQVKLTDPIESEPNVSSSTPMVSSSHLSVVYPKARPTENSIPTMPETNCVTHTVASHELHIVTKTLPSSTKQRRSKPERGVEQTKGTCHATSLPPSSAISDLLPQSDNISEESGGLSLQTGTPFQQKRNENKTPTGYVHHYITKQKAQSKAKPPMKISQASLSSRTGTVPVFKALPQKQSGWNAENSSEVTQESYSTLSTAVYEGSSKSKSVDQQAVSEGVLGGLHNPQVTHSNS